MKKYLIYSFIVLGFLWVNIASATKVIEVINDHFQYDRLQSQNINVKGDYTDLWFVLSQSEDFLNTNITQMLSSSEERSSNLSAYLRDGTSLQSALNYHSNSLTVELQQVENKIQLCKTQLSTANQLYVNSFKTRNENGFNSAVNSAQRARSCLWEQEVRQSALNNLLSQVKSYLSYVSKRTNYLKNNQSLILRHYDILKPSLLKELYPIAVELEQNNNKL